MINRVQGNYNLNQNTIKNRYFNKGDSKNKLMSTLEKLKDELTEQKEKLKEQNLSPEDILEKTKKIDEQIEDIDSQMSLIIERAKEDADKKLAEDIKEHNEEEKLKNEDEEQMDGVIVSESLSYLVKNHNLCKSVSKLKELKSRYEKSSGIAKKIDMAIADKLKEINNNSKKNLSFVEKSNEKE